MKKDMRHTESWTDWQTDTPIGGIMKDYPYFLTVISKEITLSFLNVAVTCYFLSFGLGDVCIERNYLYKLRHFFCDRKWHLQSIIIVSYVYVIYRLNEHFMITLEFIK